MKTVIDKTITRAAIRDGLLRRFGVAVAGADEAAKRCSESSFVELIRQTRPAGRPVWGAAASVRAELAWGGGVFSGGLLEALAVTFKIRYAKALRNWKKWANNVEVPVLTGKRVVIDAAGSPAAVEPGKEYPSSGMSGRDKDISQDKFGFLLKFPDEIILADDIGFINATITQAVNRAVLVEDDVVIAALTGATGFFLAANGNRLTSNSLAAAGLTAAIKAVRTMENATKAKLRLSPRVLLVPAALENTAKDLLRTDLLMDDDDGRIIPVVDSRLDAASETTWYLVADKQQTDSIVLQFLKGFTTEPEVVLLPPRLDYDGAKYRVKHVCGGEAVNPYGIVRSEA